jgi:hypothetical protein
MELAQSRAARERTLAAGAAKQAAETAANAAASSGAASSGAARVGSSSKRHAAGHSNGPVGEGDGEMEGRDGVDVVVVTGYEKKSITSKLFGRKKK